METGEATGIKNELEPKEDEMGRRSKRFAKEDAARLLYTPRGMGGTGKNFPSRLERQGTRLLIGTQGTGERVDGVSGGDAYGLNGNGWGV